LVVLYLLSGLVLLIILFVAFYAIVVIKVPPNVPGLDLSDYSVTKTGDISRIGNNWLTKNKWGLYEMYIEGPPFERGVVNGRLAEKLIYTQEKIFVAEIKKIIPSNFYLGFLKYIVAWINRKLKSHIGEEYNMEIYGVSLSASKDFRLIGPNYMRMLNYHAAHDIGHMLQDMNLVGCSSFAALGNRTADGKIIHARNFDFYVGDEFCKEKIVTFYAPEKGNKFVMITWGALIGTVSGMNMNGLAITVNAAKSKLPVKTTTPVTILIREMLQYASTIDEVIDIARKRKISVSESFMVSSGPEQRVLIIEKTPYRTEIFDPGTEQILCTNHFQSEALKDDPLNLQQIEENASMYRYKRLWELLERFPKITIQSAVDVLRDRFGIHDEPIGDGNEKTMNQLLAHHSLVFNPNDLKMWISTGPFGLGEFICYDLHNVFEKDGAVDENTVIVNEHETIAADDFLYDGGFERFEKFKEIKDKLANITSDGALPLSMIDDLIALNPSYFLTYSVAGDYFKKKQHYEKAVELYQSALQKEIPTLKELEVIRKNLDRCEKKRSQHR